MSLEKIIDVLYHSKAEGARKLVLIGIANHEGDQGSYPAVATLAKYANCSERQVKRHIAALQEMGELEVKYQGAPIEKQYRPNLYFTKVSGVTSRVNSGVTSEAGVTLKVSRGDTEGKSGVTPVSPEPAVNLSKEPLNSLSEKKSKAHAIPEDFKPSEKAWAEMDEHFPHIDLKLETHSFRDYWLSKTGKDSLKKDWDATWRNWIRNAHKRMMTSPAWQKAMKEAEREREIQRLYEDSGD